MTSPGMDSWPGMNFVQYPPWIPSCVTRLKFSFKSGWLDRDSHTTLAKLAWQIGYHSIQGPPVAKPGTFRASPPQLWLLYSLHILPKNCKQDENLWCTQSPSETYPPAFVPQELATFCGSGPVRRVLWFGSEMSPTGSRMEILSPHLLVDLGKPQILWKWGLSRGSLSLRGILYGSSLALAFRFLAAYTMQSDWDHSDCILSNHESR